ncbi:MAG: HPF/RaiA family ribosome-associated protein [Flavobacteriales bacterium]|nr:HPF/RaiA family ribosome-associated protein [Flavobacteriales bacterium]
MNHKRTEVMIIQTNTDNHIDGNGSLKDHVSTVVTHKLGHWTDRITRVEVHLNDENGEKNGQRDHRCSMEVRPEGARPMAVTHFAPDLHQAIAGAAEKLANLVAAHFDKALPR